MCPMPGRYRRTREVAGVHRLQWCRLQIFVSEPIPTVDATLRRQHLWMRAEFKS